MNYGEVRDAALNLVHQETIAGEMIPPTYNNQQDYLNKIPSLINAAQMDIATTAKFIPEAVMLANLRYTEMGHNRVYTLPGNMWQRRGSGLLVPTLSPLDDGAFYRRFNQVRMIGRDKLIVPSKLPEDTILEYFRYPEQLSGNPSDTEEMDNVPEVHVILPYYVAAHLVITDDPFLYASFYNTYESRKAGLQELVYSEPGQVEDVLTPGLYDIGW